MDFKHISVLADEAVEGLNIRKGKTYIDGTLGGAGHSKLIAERLDNEGLLICLDQDETAIENGKKILDKFNNVRIIKTNFRYMDNVVNSQGFNEVDGILLDLGVSSPQLDVAERGFSYNFDTRLDMRMDLSQELSAYTIVNEWDEKELSLILMRYGEEKFSRRIAKQIVLKRNIKPIETTGELVEIIKDAIPAPARRTGPHPAKRSFQAIRIAVNDELGSLEDVLEKGLQLLAKNGRFAVITFHSLEDRIVKKIFQKYTQGCTCPPGFPKCVCGNDAKYKLINRKAIKPNDDEINSNPRSRSAMLRIIEKI
jgi:16S rRNA (cytosine1402-N4)-methyltransferase